MIDLYTWPTPNGRKISIMLEELKVPYTIYPIDILNEEQFSDKFSQISPTHKIPAIVDRENEKSFFESCLLYTSPSPRDGLLSGMPSCG